MSPEQLIEFQKRLLVAVWPDDQISSAANRELAVLHGRNLANDLKNTETVLLLYERLFEVVTQLQILAPREEIKKQVIARDKKLVEDAKTKREEPAPIKGQVPNWKKVLAANPSFNREDAQFYVKLQKSHPDMKDKMIKELIRAMKGTKK